LPEPEGGQQGGAGGGHAGDSELATGVRQHFEWQQPAASRAGSTSKPAAKWCTFMRLVSSPPDERFGRRVAGAKHF
jgi:hypothetical protein